MKKVNKLLEDSGYVTIKEKEIKWLSLFIPALNPF